MTRMRKTIIFLAAIVILVFAATFGYNKVMKWLYPKQYMQLVSEFCAQKDLDENFVYAVIKCESGFDKDAVSSVGAKGLMQLTDDTFAWVQTKDPNVDLGPEALFNPETNIRFGTLLLSMHISEFGNEETALAAYHAGRGIVNKWLIEGEVSVETIPYVETVAYIKKVFRTKELYEKLYK